MCVALSSCGNKTAQAPSAPSYHWTDKLTYRVDYVSLAQRNGQELMKFAETKTIRLAKRDAQYLGAYDSVLKTSQRPGQPLVLAPYVPEDTLIFYAKLGAHGELTDVALGCDPTLAACASALPSSVLLELRRLIPRLPLFPAPLGGGWVDTLAFDDANRPGGNRGRVVVRYSSGQDTTIAGHAYWQINWHSVRRAFRPGQESQPSLGAEQPVEEIGVTFVDKQQLVPVYSTWAGAVAAPPQMRAIGATASGFRGRAYLAGSVFDSLYAHQIGP